MTKRTQEAGVQDKLSGRRLETLTQETVLLQTGLIGVIVQLIVALVPARGPVYILDTRLHPVERNYWRQHPVKRGVDVVDKSNKRLHPPNDPPGDQEY